MIEPLVSILLPVRNAESYLAACLESLLTQSYDNIEIVAIDDFSTDNSYQILSHYRKYDKRIKLSRNVKKYGLRLTLNRCLKRANGNFIAFMNQKDISTKSKIQRQVKYLQENPRMAAVGTQCHFIDENDKVIEASAFPQEHDAIYNRLVYGMSVQPESILINKLNLPKDVIQFSKDKYPFLYRRLLVNIVKYGEIANIKTKLYMHRTSPSLKTVNGAISTAKLWIKSRALDDYRPPLRFLLFPFVKGI